MSSSVKSRLKAAKRSKGRGTPGGLRSSIRTLSGVGSKREDLLRELGLVTVGDLLVYPPKRYIDRSTFCGVADLRNGETGTVVGAVTDVEIKPARRGPVCIVHVEDESGGMRLAWFGQPYLRNVFRPGDTFVFSGRVTVDRFGRSMVHPEYERMDGELLHTGRIVPVYPTRAGLSQKQIRHLVKQAVDGYLPEVTDCVPASIRRRFDLPHLRDAIGNLHFPADAASAEQARKRLALDEVLVFQTLFALSRKERGGSMGERAGEDLARFTRHLPFQLTRSQEEALATVVADLESPYPMRRLLQGDVGCGKTAVAALAAAVACSRGGQVALMCPTELLAEQHHCTLERFMRPLGYSVGLLTGSMPAEESRRVRAGLGSGDQAVVVGTHALLSGGTDFRNLMLAVVDEEQRFGVLQRTRLVDKTPHANLLVVSATPIPRTLALAAYGDLDMTVIDEMPPGRGPHRTVCVPEKEREALLDRIARDIEGGAQGFYVCPAVDRSEAGLVDVGGALSGMKRRLGKRRAEMLTGRTPAGRRSRIIEDFRCGRIGVIVATTVIEVGMDIPAATILVVDQADRFGLSQLHQMRGRVARTGSESGSYMILSDSASEQAIRRIGVLESTFDGFRIAEEDLALRGPGDLVGTRQHGVPDLRFARLPEDTDLMLAAREEAFERTLGGRDDEEWPAWLEVVRNLVAGEVTVV
jgi:ATP-dependent DNA helicase RecG